MATSRLPRSVSSWAGARGVSESHRHPGARAQPSTADLMCPSRPSSGPWPTTFTVSTTRMRASALGSSQRHGRGRAGGAVRLASRTSPVLTLSIPSERTGHRHQATLTCADLAVAGSYSGGVSERSGLITHPDKVLFRQRGETKADLAAYYTRVAGPLLRIMGGRPVLLQRFPEGADGPSFFQKRVPQNVPGWLQTTTVATPNGTTSRALVAADIDHVLWAVNLGCLGFHVWPYLAADPAHADELRIDLDPSPGTGFPQIREAARELRRLLGECGITGYPKTTGNRGLHVYVRLQPRWDSYQVRAAAVAVARELERRRPDLITAAWWKEERGQRVFVDFNQNAPHKTVFGAWSVRARPGAQVSTPLSLAGDRRHGPGPAHDRDGAGPAGPGRRSVAGHGRAAPVAPADAGHE